MALDKVQPQEVDLDRTDRLPILPGAVFDEDVGDDAVPMDHTAVLPGVRAEFPRPSGVDLPSLAESVRSVEERIARQNAEFEALTRTYEKSRESESAAIARADALSADLAAALRALEAEQIRSRDFDKALVDKNAAADLARVRVEETQREVERHQAEARALRDALAARDATIVHVTHSLGERDAQLSALQREHARVVPALEERSRVSAQLETALNAARAHSESLEGDLGGAQRSVSSLSAKLKVGDAELTAVRRELNALNTRATSYLETLRTREWRRGFDHNLFRDLDTTIGKHQDDGRLLQSERDRLREHLAEAEAKLAARDADIASLRAAAQAAEALRVDHELKQRQVEGAHAELAHKVALLEAENGRLDSKRASQEESIAALESALRSAEQAQALHQTALSQFESARADWSRQIAALQHDIRRLNDELAARDKAVADARAAAAGEVQVIKDSLAAAQAGQAGAGEEIARLQSEAQAREEEMSVLIAHLQEARRPIQTIEAEVRRLNDELAARALTLDQLNEENRTLRAGLERTRGALEEREFLIRRLERSESNNANVLGRIQTSIERLGAAGALGGVTGGLTGSAAGGAAAPVECAAELIRIDGPNQTTHVLSRRTRIGRAPGCEMQIESTSVSRHHAMVMMGPRDVVIEDLNSTNGVLVNGRKVSRHTLSDGDLVTIGDAQFKLSVKFVPRVLDAASPELP